MTLEEYTDYLKQAYLLCRLAAGIPVPDLLARINRAETIGPFIDPTLYRDKSQAMHEDKTMLEALFPLHAFAQTIFARREEG